MGDWADQEQKRLKEAGLPYKKKEWCTGCAQLKHPGAINFNTQRIRQNASEILVNKLATGTANTMELPTAFRLFYKAALPQIQADPASYVDGKAPRMGQLMKRVKGELAASPLLGRALPSLLSAQLNGGSARVVLRIMEGTQPRAEGTIRAGCAGLPRREQVRGPTLGRTSTISQWACAVQMNTSPSLSRLAVAMTLMQDAGTCQPTRTSST